MNNIKNIEHSLAVIANIKTTVEDTLEKKLNEIISTSGGVVAANEVIKRHKEFIDKTKVELSEQVKNSKMAVDIANIMLKAMGQSHEVLVNFLSDKAAQNNAKKGEALAYGAQVRLLNANYESMEKTKLELEKAEAEAEKAANELAEKQSAEKERLEAEVREPLPVMAAVQQEAEKKKRGRKRPDEIGKMGETVKRLKEARSRKKS